MVQHGADMLQGGVKLTVDTPQLAALAHLAAHIEPETRVRFVYRYHPRPVVSHHRRFVVIGNAATTAVAVFDRHTIGHVLTKTLLKPENSKARSPHHNSFRLFLSHFVFLYLSFPPLTHICYSIHIAPLSILLL